MDDIYGHIENYDEVNIVNELKSENERLKEKLSHYGVTMDKLQKNILQDFDHLTYEYKKLETNYSSLLKTARAEIERKTNLITNLNKEKDMLILNSANNRHNRDRWTAKKMAIPTKTVESNNKCVKRGENIHFQEQHKNRVEGTYTPSEMPADVKSKFCGSRDSKENHDNAHYQDSYSKSQSLGIHKRRKSMIAASTCSPKFSSDDESDKLIDVKKPLEDIERRFMDRYSDKFSTKTSETSSIEDRHGIQDMPPENRYRGRDNRYPEGGRYKSRNFDRHRRPQNTDMFLRREIRDRDDRFRRRDYNGRRSASPPRDYRKQRSSRFSNIDDSSKDLKRKYKDVEHYGEQEQKRQRMEMYDRDREKECHKPKEDLSKVAEDIKFSTCQSPDYVTDNTLPQPVTEIKATATIQLEDPRVSSKKYVKEVVQDKTVLATCIGRNVDLKSCTWGGDLESKRKINIYKDQEDTDDLASVESGELIDSLYDFSWEKTQNKDENAAEPKVYRENKQNTESKILNPVEETEHSAKILKYKIQKKISEADKEKVCDNGPLGKLIKNFSDSIENKKTVEDDTKSKPKHPRSRKSSKEVAQINNEEQQNTQLEEILTNENLVEGDLHLSDDSNDPNQSINENVKKSLPKVAATTRKSDDVVDGKKLLGRLSCKDENVSIEPSDIKPRSRKKSIDRNKHDHDSSTAPPKDLDNRGDSRNKTTKDICKKPAAKKKPRTKQATCKDTSEAENEIIVEKKTRPRKEKATKSEEITDKFTDLFGADSSSLITPEDLGLIAAKAPDTLSSNYIPIFDDAVADVEDVKVTKIQSPVEKNHKEFPTPVEVFKPIANTDHEINEESTTSYREHSQQNKSKTISVTIENIPNIIYDNLDPETMEDETSVVKTVVISTGVQKPLAVEVNTRTEDAVEPLLVQNTKVDRRPVALVQDLGITALATSTPAKEKMLKLPDTDAALNQSCNSTTSAGDAASVNCSGDTDAQADVPDVRIFVKRRKKIKKAQ